MNTREIPGFPGYRVSDTGIIESRWRRGGGVATLLDVWKPINGGVARGHRYVWLYDAKRGKHFRYVHEIVLTIFVGPCPAGMEGCHRNDNGLDNRLENLRWDTRASNREDAHRNDRIANGERVSTHKLTASEVISIRERHAAGEFMRDIAADFGITRTNVSMIVNRHTWKHL